MPTAGRHETNVSQSPLDRNLLRLGPRNQSSDNKILSEQGFIDQNYVDCQFAYSDLQNGAGTTKIGPHSSYATKLHDEVKS